MLEKVYQFLKHHTWKKITFINLGILQYWYQSELYLSHKKCHLFHVKDNTCLVNNMVRIDDLYLIQVSCDNDTLYLEILVICIHIFMCK